MSVSPCPLCAATQGIEVQPQRLALAGLGTVDIGFGYCGACGHIYQLRSVSDEVLGRHYETFSNYTCFDAEAARNAPAKASTLRLLRLAETHTTKRGRAYEVGCATASHLVQFARAGWQVGGCDLSPKACGQAQEIFGIDVDCGSEADMLPRQKDIDLLYFCHVLEHLRDPLPALVRAREALADDGMLLIEVPCAIAPGTLPPGWFTFEHLQYFSTDVLCAVLEQTGFKPLEIRIALKAELYPVIAVIAVKSEQRVPPLANAAAAEKTRQFLSEFTSRDDTLWQAVGDRLADLPAGIFIWGAGVHTAQLMQRTQLNERTRIVGIVDRDSQKWGSTQADCPIISPEKFLTHRGAEPVVISSYAAEREIAQGLRQSGVAEDRIVRLYA